MAVANSIIGVKAGANYIDCTLFGIGERAGNCNFYDFIHACESIFSFPMNHKQVKCEGKTPSHGKNSRMNSIGNSF